MNGHIRHTGYHITAGLAVLLPMVTFFHPDRTKLSTLLILIISLTSHWAFLFWTGGRGAIISVFAASLFVAAIAYRDNTNFRFYILIALSTAIVGFVIAELYSVFFWNGVLSSLDRMNISSGINKLSTGRMEFWKTSLHSLKQSPFFGLGPQGYYYMPNRVFGLHPHNFIIQFLVEWGLIGTLLILAVLFRVLKKGFKNLILGSKSKNNQTRLIGASIVVALTIHALTDGTYYHGQPSFYLAIGYASMLIPFYHQKDMK
jgi:O-antigen ligase